MYTERNGSGSRSWTATVPLTQGTPPELDIARAGVAKQRQSMELVHL
jgi:hypothetical protein